MGTTSFMFTEFLFVQNKLVCSGQIEWIFIFITIMTTMIIYSKDSYCSIAMITMSVHRPECNNHHPIVLSSQLGNSLKLGHAHLNQNIRHVRTNFISRQD